MLIRDGGHVCVKNLEKGGGENAKRPVMDFMDSIHSSRIRGFSFNNWLGGERRGGTI